MKYHLADTLTVSRIIIAILAAFAILRGEWSVAVWLVMVGGLTDAFDGMLARKWKLPASKRFYGSWMTPKDFDERADGIFCAVLVFAPAARLIVANLNDWSDGGVSFWFSVPLLIVECFLTPFFILATQKLNKVDAFEIDIVHGWYCAALMFGSLVLVTWMAYDGHVFALLLMTFAAAMSWLVILKRDRATSRPGVVYPGTLSWSQFLHLQWK